MKRTIWWKIKRLEAVINQFLKVIWRNFFQDIMIFLDRGNFFREWLLFDKLCTFLMRWLHVSFFAENQYVRVLWTFNLDHDDGSTSADGKTNQFPSWFRRGIFCIAKCSCQKAYRSKNKFRIHPKFFSWNRRTKQKCQNLAKEPCCKLVFPILAICRPKMSWN